MRIIQRLPPLKAGLLASIVFLLGSSCQTEVNPSLSLDQVAEAYVRLVLSVGEHDADYVDAYYGPDEWRSQVELEAKSLEEISREAISARSELQSLDPSSLGEMSRLRHQYLLKQLDSLKSRVEMLRGREMSFDEESAALYDAVSPPIPQETFEEVLSHLSDLLLGKGDLVDRLGRFKQDFVIPEEKLDAVFQAAIRECRERTARFVELPEEERFSLEYVQNKPWSGYNWYQGGYASLIQLNTDLPITIDRAIDLACHEGYPGHHVYHTLMEWRLVKQRSWLEHSVYPLFSPQAVISEGAANYGTEIAFAGQERLEFEAAVLFPLAGLDPNRAAGYYRVQKLLKRLNYAGNEAARRYLDGRIDRDGDVNWLQTYALMSREKANQRLQFIDKYRSYVINYNLGLDLVRSYLDTQVGSGADPDQRWKAFEEILSSPRVPSGLR